MSAFTWFRQWVFPWFNKKFRSLAGRCWLRILPTLVFGLILPNIVKAEYILTPGDEITLSIGELPDSTVVSRIDIDGKVSFPRLGSFQASGFTLTELRENINLETAGMVISIYSPSGEWFQVTIDGTSIYLGMKSYLPVFVTGDVARPGPVEFQPGMTVRTALASGGGVLSSLISPQEALVNAPVLRSNLTTLAIEHANLVAELWSLNALFERDENLSMSGLPSVSVNKENFEAFILSRKDQVRLMLRERLTEYGHLEDQLATLTKRIDLFNEKLRNQEQLIELAKEEVISAETLVEKGLARASVLSNARQSLLALSSNTLEAESILAELELQRKLIHQRIDIFDSSFNVELLEARATLEPRIKSLSSEILGAQESLVLNDGGAGSILRQFEEDLKLYLIRGTGDKATTSDASFDDILRPGDVVEVDNIVLFPESSEKDQSVGQ
ncbi:polysaccharide biosynthesis/export family protein [Ruegeria arenilitoris]|uniref:polysaccharide biosynthesis/export family protein n=1 Tax=Ruegeria arenilitoris TaxID=1173585 RepID=UPI00147E8989